MKTIVTVMLFAVMSLFAGSVVASVATSGPNPLTHNYDLALAVSAAGLMALQVGMKYGPALNAGYSGLTQAGIAQEFWVDVIIDKLFAANDVVMRTHNESEYVLGGSVVHLPQAGAAPTVVKNRSSFPATAVRRTDTTGTYELDVYTTDPTHIPDAEKMEISYDKVASVLRDHLEQLRTTITVELLHKWAGVGATQILRTTGADSALNLAPSATGTRKVFTAADLKRAMVALNKQDVPQTDRVVLLPSDMYGELLDDPFLQNRDVAKEADYKNGILARLYGFDIMERSANTLFTNAGTPVKKAPDAASAVSDNQSALAFQGSCLTHARGEVRFFENVGDPQFYGDVYSALVKFGGRQRRTVDGKGVISIVQAHGA